MAHYHNAYHWVDAVIYPRDIIPVRQSDGIGKNIIFVEVTIFPTCWCQNIARLLHSVSPHLESVFLLIIIETAEWNITLSHEISPQSTRKLQRSSICDLHLFCGFCRSRNSWTWEYCEPWLIIYLYYLFIYIFIYLFVYLSICLFTYLFVIFLCFLPDLYSLIIFHISKATLANYIEAAWMGRAKLLGIRSHPVSAPESLSDILSLTNLAHAVQKITTQWRSKYSRWYEHCSLGEQGQNQSNRAKLRTLQREVCFTNVEICELTGPRQLILIGYDLNDYDSPTKHQECVLDHLMLISWTIF